MYAYYVNVLPLHCCSISYTGTGNLPFYVASTTLTNEAMAPASVTSLALIIYTGFPIPIKDMHPWFRWINYLDPVAYAYESLMINEVPKEHIYSYAESNGDLVPRSYHTLHAVCSARPRLW